MKIATTGALALMIGLGATATALAEDLPEIAITLKDHRFTPAEVQVPTGKAVMLVVTNLDNQADEFEMHLPALEKVVPAGGTVKVRLRPLGVGSFPFFADFHRETGKGVIVSK
jgi:hypothetical protein